MSYTKKQRYRTAEEQAEDTNEAANMLAMLRDVTSQPNGLKKDGDRVTISLNNFGARDLKEVR